MRCEACWRAQFAFAGPHANLSVVRRDASTLTPRSAKVFYGWRPAGGRLHPHCEIRVEPIPQAHAYRARQTLPSLHSDLLWPTVTLLTPTQGNIPLRSRIRSLRQTLCRAGVAYGFTQPDHPRADCYLAEIVGVGLAGTTCWQDSTRECFSSIVRWVCWGLSP